MQVFVRQLDGSYIETKGSHDGPFCHSAFPSFAIFASKAVRTTFAGLAPPACVRVFAYTLVGFTFGKLPNALIRIYRASQICVATVCIMGIATAFTSGFQVQFFKVARNRAEEGRKEV